MRNSIAMEAVKRLAWLLHDKEVAGLIPAT